VSVEDPVMASETIVVVVVVVVVVGVGVVDE
jgi:hypothetical protein